MQVESRFNEVTGRHELSVPGSRNEDPEAVAETYLRAVSGASVRRAYLRGERAAVADLLVRDPRFHLCAYGLDMARSAGRCPAGTAAVRLAGPEDSAVIADVLNDSYGRSPNSRVPESWVREDMFAAGWHNVLVPDQGDPQAYGCAIADGSEGIVNWVCVRPSAQGRGYGSAITDALLHWLGETDVERFVLGVEAWNALAIRLYERRGFVDTGRRHAFVTFD